MSEERKRKEEEGGSGAPLRVITYADMVSLLICFFSALFNVSEVDELQLQQMISSLSNIGMGASEGGATLTGRRNA